MINDLDLYRLPSQQFSQLMPVAFENLISVLDTTSPFFDMCARHFIHSVFFHFPDNFLDGLSLALSGSFFCFPQFLIKTEKEEKDKVMQGK